jgi:membrane associated rhomboid family serine protease
MSIAKLVYTEVYYSTCLADFRFQGSIVKKQYYGIGLFVAAMWLVFLANSILPIHLEKFGLYPRSFSGIFGILLMPFLHTNFDHLLGNTIPLIVLLFLLISSRKDAWLAVGCIVVGSGGLLWIFGRSAVHVGASGLTFGLCSFLIAVGVRERRVIPITIAVLVGLIYGGTMLSGVIPQWRSNISWDGHLCGLLAGGLVGFWLSRPKVA